MPNEVVNHKHPERQGGEEESHELSVLLQKVIGVDSGAELTPEQRDEILSQRRQITEFIHEDKQQDSYDKKFYLVVIICLFYSFQPSFYGKDLMSFLKFFPWS